MRRKSKYDRRLRSNYVGRRTVIRDSNTIVEKTQHRIAELKRQVSSRQGRVSTRSKSRPALTAVFTYIGIFLFVMSLVSIGYQPPRKSDTVALAATTATPTSSGKTVSVDQLVATQVAAGIAERAELPIAANVSSLSQSLSLESQLAQQDTSLISKPQIVQPTADSRTIKSYTAKAGDTVQKIATEYAVSVNTIKWANNLTSDNVESGKQLTIPPVDGIIYTVKSGDTIDTLAAKYKSDKDSIIAFNDLELAGISPGAKLVIPGGNLPANEQPGYVAPVQRSTSTYSGGYANYYAAVDPSLANSYGSNGYAYGNCTWYAYNRRAQIGRPVGGRWGNASTWASYASMAGIGVDGTPEAGAVMANGGGYAGYGHVAVVEEVVQGEYVRISEMNSYRGGGGYGRVSYFNIPWGEAMSGMYRYIH